MTAQDRIVAYLTRASGESYCDDCLSAALKVPFEQVEQETRTLAEEGWFKRSVGPCEGCGLTKHVSKRRISSFAA
jgi:hypothetical protein